MKLALVESIYPSNFRDPVETLRSLADEIEAGKYGEVGCVAVALLGDALEIFGMGPDSEAPSVHLLFCAGARQLEQPIIDHGTQPLDTAKSS